MATGRDSKGRFVKGNRFGVPNKRGRPTDAVRLELHAIIDKNVSRKSVNAAWKRLGSALETGGKGWLEYFKFYLDRRYGRPEQFISADVMSGGEPLVNVITIIEHGAPNSNTDGGD